MDILSRFAVSIGLAGLVACAAGQAILSVGGTYQTVVTLVSSTCPDTRVETHPTTVTHTPGTTAIRLRHAGSEYTGTVKADGSFVTTTLTQTFGTTVYRLEISGRFTTTAMVADVLVANVSAGCGFTARWAGPKDGPATVRP